MAKQESISSQQRVFFDKVYNTNISLTPLEQKIVNTEVFERLKRISQLGLAYLIYPNAKHTRFDHSLGTMYLAGKIAKRLGLSEDDAQYFRLAALLHDTGHGPFSHAFEEYLRERGRIRGHEELTKWVILNSEIKDKIGDSGFDSRKIADLSAGKIKDEKLSFLNPLILGVIDVDKMDFLVRDAHFTKSKCREIDVNELTSSVEKVDAGKVAWAYGCLSSLETFFRCKEDMYMSVYYGKEVRAIDIMIRVMLKSSDEEIDWGSFKEIEDFKLLTDSYVLDKMQEMSRKASTSDEMSIAVGLCKDLLRKDFIDNAFEKISYTQYPQRRSSIINEEEILDVLIDYLDMDRRLVFVDILDFSTRATMSFTKTGKADMYLLENEDPISITDIEGSLNQLLGVSCQIVRVYVASQYAKKLRKITGIIRNTIENLLRGT